MSPSGREQATAFAPASAANVAIGFDILGFSVDVLGDKVSVKRTQKPGVVIAGSSGVVKEIPRDPERNTAGRALLAMQEVLKPGFGFEVFIDKGIPLGSGLGGSAASAVAAVVAANALLDKPLSKIELLQFAMQGEKVSSGSLHVDNISPSLFGGLVLTVGIDHPRVKQIPVPEGIRAVLVHPHLFLSTKQARGILKRRLHFGLLHQRPRHDPRVVRGRSHREAAVAAHPGIRQRAQRSDRRRRTRLHHFRRRAHHVCVGARGRCRESARRHGGRVRRGQHESGSLDRAHQDRGRVRTSRLSRA